MRAFPHLFAPTRIGRLELRNRLVLTGHGTGMGRDGAPDERMIAYYAARAAGGVGLIMLGSQQVHPTSPGITGLLTCYDDRAIPGLSRLVQAVRGHGARIFGYLSHMGSATTARPVALWSASAVHEQKYGEVAHAMDAAEIAEIVAAFAAAARRNRAAGMDGIEVHCGHGLLLQQFLSPLTNRRADRYGGDEANRARFPAEVLAAVRAAIGPDVPLGIRFSADELIAGGLDAAAMRRIVPLLVAAGRLDYLDVSAGNDGDLVSNMLHEPPMGLPPAPFADLARGIRAAVPGVPVIHGTGIHDAALAESLIAEGSADLIGMCRPLIADPDLPAKAMRGNAAAVTPCVACEQACFGRLFRGRHISCVGNPRTGREAELPAEAAATAPRHVVVIGGGPAGMEAALVAARRGHRVTLVEAASELGGRLRLAARAPTRGAWARLIEHKATMLAEARVTVRLGCTADAPLLAALSPDVVVHAGGAEPHRGDLGGAAAERVFTADQIMLGEGPRGGRAAVIDLEDRMAGATAALALQERGCAVTIVTRAAVVGQRLEIQNFTFMMREFFRRGIALLPHHACAAIEPGGTLLLRNAYTGETRRETGFEFCVVAGPGVSRPAPTGVLADHVIGDAFTPRDVEAAILEGHRAGLAV